MGKFNDAFLKGELMQLSMVSNLTGKRHSMDIGISPEEFNEGLTKMKQEISVQCAFPQLDADKREFIVSGITPEEWDSCMGGTDDD